MNDKRKTKIYLDTSVYNSPFDDQSQPRICIETLSFVAILEMIQTDHLELSTSSFLIYENSRNPFQLRKKWVNSCIALSKHFVSTWTKVFRYFTHRSRQVCNLPVNATGLQTRRERC